MDDAPWIERLAQVAYHTAVESVGIDPAGSPHRWEDQPESVREMWSRIVTVIVGVERARCAAVVSASTEKYRTWDFTGSDTNPAAAYELGRMDQGVADAAAIREGKSP